jgi:hypothetical protein
LDEAGIRVKTITKWVYQEKDKAACTGFYLPGAVLNTAMKTVVPYKAVKLAMRIISNCRIHTAPTL